MESWLTTAFIAFLLFGLWGFFPKLAVQYINPASAIIYQVAGTMVVALLALKLVDFRPEVHPKGILFAVLTGVTGMLGTLFFLYSLRTGKVSIVATLTALYPLLTITLAHIVLHEQISARQVVAIILAMASLVLFAV